MSGTAQIGLYAEFAGNVIRQLPRDISSEQMKRWNADQASLQRILRSALMPVEKSDDGFFTITDDPNIKTSEIVARLRQKFKVYVYREEHLDTDFPAPKEATTRRFKKTVEADPEYAGKSANDVQNLPGITLRERLLTEEAYFDEAGKHLDPKTWTICSGSRYSGGDVPFVGWGPASQGLGVGWDWPDCRGSGGRPRVAVS